MSSQDKHITHWSTSDVQKYLKGELSPREMHQLEKAALEDPFLADAIEGLAQRPATPLAGDLHELQTRLTDRTARKNKRPVAWMKMAAVIVLLLGLGYSAWYVLVNKATHQESQIAKVPVPPAPKTSQATEPPQTNAATSGIADTTRTADIVDTTGSADIVNTTGSAGSALLAKTTPPTHKHQIPLPAAEFVAKEKSIPDSISMQNSRVASLDYLYAPAQANRMAVDSMTGKKQMVRRNAEYDYAFRQDSLRASGSNRFHGFDSQAVYKNFGGGYLNQNLVFNGQVLDLNNRPLPGASLLVSGRSNAITTTNDLGQFKLNLQPQDTTQQLTVALVGYQNASLAVNKLNTDEAIGNTIVLKANPHALSEVVVTGEGRARKESFATAPFEDKKEKVDSFWAKVTPVTGRLAYLDYLATAKKALPVDSTIRGAEIISFGIDPTGAPTDFKIEHSLSPAHDAGVIRLITEGARWKILHGKNVRAMVDVSFP